MCCWQTKNASFYDCKKIKKLLQLHENIEYKNASSEMVSPQCGSCWEMASENFLLSPTAATVPYHPNAAALRFSLQGRRNFGSQGGSYPFFATKSRTFFLKWLFILNFPPKFFDLPPVLFLSKEAPELVGAKEIYTHPTVYSVSAMWTKQLIEYIVWVGAWFSYFKLVSSVLKLGRNPKKYIFLHIFWVIFFWMNDVFQILVKSLI